MINYQRNLPVVNGSFSNPTKTDTKTKEKKSIFDCENEKWCEPKKDDNTVTTYKKIYFDEHSPPEYIEIVIKKKWMKPERKD
jgi:hypothetical protein